MSAARRTEGLTLVEMLAVVVLVGVVFTGVMRFYTNISSATTRAADLTRDDRRAASVLDRIARDLAATTLLVKPDEVDPLSHPWLFLAESRSASEGADHLKFDSRSGRLGSREHGSDLHVVAYYLSPDDSGAQAIVRWSHPELPEELDRDFPRADDPGAEVFVEGVASFGVRLLDDEGSWVDEWDSSTVVRSSQLPVAAEIEITMVADAEQRGGIGDAQNEPLRRRVLMPLRPIDLAVLAENGGLGAGGDEADADEEADVADSCVTVAQCQQRVPEVFTAWIGSDESRADVVQSMANQCIADVAANLQVDLSACE